MQNQSTQHSGPFPHLLVCQFQRSFKFLPVIALLAFRQLVQFPHDTGFHLFRGLIRKGHGKHIFILRRNIENDLEIFHR